MTNLHAIYINLTLRTNHPNHSDVFLHHQPPALLLYWETADLRGAGSRDTLAFWSLVPWCILKFRFIIDRRLV